MPRFSIVVPAYNAEATLAGTLDAVLSQQFDDWECIVVDDGSTDGTRVVALDYASRDDRLQVLAQANQGSGGAYNTGVRAALGEFVVLCSADDILLPEHLRTVAAFIDAHPGFDIYSTNGSYLRPDGSRDPVYAEGEMPSSLGLADVIRACFYSVGTAYRRELFDSVGGYRNDVFGEDYDFWLRAMAAGARHCYVPGRLSLHRLSDTQKSADLAAAYRSDIRLIADLVASGTLTPVERALAEDAIEAREALITRLAGGHAVRDRARTVASRLLGSANLRRILRRLKGAPR